RCSLPSSARARWPTSGTADARSSPRYRSARSGNPNRSHTMEFFRIRKTIPFMRHALVLNVISLITCLAAVFFIATKGFHLSIEFTGGTVMEVAYPQAVELDQVRSTIAAKGY